MFKFILLPALIFSLLLPSACKLPNADCKLKEEEETAYVTMPASSPTSGEGTASPNMDSLIAKIPMKTAAIKNYKTPKKRKYTTLDGVDELQADMEKSGLPKMPNQKNQYEEHDHSGHTSSNGPPVIPPDEKEAPWLKTLLKRDRNIKYGQNGCGIWAVAVCNRILGLETGPLTQTEWDKIRSGLGALPFYAGITMLSYIASYYQTFNTPNRRFVSTTEPFTGFPKSYEEIKDKLDKGCDIKLLYAKQSKAWFTPKSNPHLETVVDVNLHLEDDKKKPDMYTNSWGKPAKITGGSCNLFTHSSNTKFGGKHEKFAWPPNDSRIWVQVTCPKHVFEADTKKEGTYMKALFEKMKD